MIGTQVSSPRTRPRLSPRKLPQQQRSEETVRAILQASTYILSRHGSETFTTNKVAERAGVNISSLYQYFPNKEALLAELMRRHSRETRAVTLRILLAHRGKSLEAMVRTLVTAGVAAHAVDPALHRALTLHSGRLGEMSGGPDSDAEMVTAWRAMLTDTSLGKRDPDFVIWMAMIAAHAIIHRVILDHPEMVDSPILIEELTKLVYGFLRKP